jgi:hypothetical protein
MGVLLEDVKRVWLWLVGRSALGPDAQPEVAIGVQGMQPS